MENSRRDFQSRQRVEHRTVLTGQRSVHDLRLKEGLARKHHWVPDYGWITFVIRKEKDFAHPLWFTRLSYSRYPLKSAPDPRDLLEKETEMLGLNPELAFELERFMHQPQSSQLQGIKMRMCGQKGGDDLATLRK